MARIITVLVCTFVFALLGLLIGYLTVQANTPSHGMGRQIEDGTLMLAYGFAPIIGSAVGFVLSSVTIWLFGPKQSV